MVARLELQAKSMAQKIVREKVEEHKQKEVVKQRELEGLHNGAVLTLLFRIAFISCSQSWITKTNFSLGIELILLT